MAIINGTGGKDILDGSTGGNVDDVLNGGLGDDVYRYSLGSGNDVITDTGGTDAILLRNVGSFYFDFGWNMYRSGSDLVIDFNRQGTLTVRGQFQGGPVVETLMSAGGWQLLSPASFTFSTALTGAAGNDILVGTSSADAINGDRGNDLLFGNAGNDTMEGGDDDDQLLGGDGDDVLVGGAGSDILIGGPGDDTLTGGDDLDLFYFAGSVDTSVDTITDFAAGLFGEGLALPLEWLTNFSAANPYTEANPFATGHARLTQAGADTLLELDTDGPDGSEAFRTIAILSNVTKTDLTANNFLVFDPGVIGILGTVAANTLNGTSAADEMHGGAGNDTMNGLAGDDALYGGMDNDELSGGDDNDRLSGDDGSDILSGGAGMDLLIGGLGNDTLTGGGNSDYFGFDFEIASVFDDGFGGGFFWFTQRYWFDDSASIADTSVDTITDFTAGAGGDLLSVPVWRLSNYLYGNPFASGHARLTQSGANTLFELDADGPNGGAAYQTLAILNNVSKGDLRAENFDGFNPNFIAGAAAADSLNGTAGDDEMYGNAGNDTLNGLAGDDILYGGPDPDQLNGGNDSDRLFGAGGNDVLNGGAGHDLLIGGSGNDTLTGGAEKDYFGFDFDYSYGFAYGIPNGYDYSYPYGDEDGDVFLGDGDRFWEASATIDTSIDTITDFVAGIGGDELLIPAWRFTNYSGGTPLPVGMYV